MPFSKSLVSTWTGMYYYLMVSPTARSNQLRVGVWESTSSCPFWLLVLISTLVVAAIDISYGCLKLYCPNGVYAVKIVLGALLLAISYQLSLFLRALQ